MSALQKPDEFLQSAYNQIAFHLGVDVNMIPPYVTDGDRAVIEGVAVKTIQHRRWSGRDKLPSIKRGRTRATMSDALAQSMAKQAKMSMSA